MAEFQAGEVVVPVVPDATGFIKKLRKDLVPGAYKLGQEIGREISRGISDKLRGVYEPLKEETRKQRQRAPKDGAEHGGAFAEGFRKRLQAGLKALPKAELDADASPAQRKVQELRARMEALSNKTVGIDIDAGAATAELRALQAELRQVQQGADINVRADVAAALGQLDALDAQVSKLEGDTATVRVDADAAGAEAKLAAARTAVAALDGSTARARVDVDVSGALAAIGTVATAMVGLSAIPVGATLGAGIVGLAAPLAAAGAGFAGLAAVAVPSLKRIGEAQTQVEQSAKSAAQSTTSAAQEAATAAQSAYQLEQAERRIVDAKRAAQQAEEALTDARRAARQAILDLREAVEDQALTLEDADLRVREARASLDKVLADPEATDLQRERADLTYRQAVEHLEDQKLRTKQLAKEQAAAEKAGVEGSARVRDAKDQLAEAIRRVKDAEAQLKLLRLQQAAADKAGAAATGGVVSQMTRLSPAAAAAGRQIEAFKDAYLSWQQRLEPAVLPVITGGLKLAEQLFKPLTPLISGTAGALVGLEKAAGKALGGGFWQGFFKDLSAAAPTAVTGLGSSLGNIATGVAGIVRAFLPFTGTVVGGLEKATKAFADWGKSLGESEGFKAFIGYVKANTPAVVEIFRNLWTLGKNVVVALAPLGSGALSGLAGLTGLLAKLSPQTLLAIATGIGTIAAGVKTWSVAQTVLNAVIRGGPLGWVLTILGLLATAIAYAWQNSETFRTVVTTAWEAIKTAIQTAWENVIKPALEGLWDFIKTYVGPAVEWLWNNVVKPAWDGISSAIKAAWEKFVKPALEGLWDFIKNYVAPAVVWFWNTVVKPTWDKISSAIKAAWEQYIKPALQSLWDFITNTLAPKLQWFYDNVVKPTWDKIGEAIEWVWENVIKKAFNFIKDAITKDVPEAFDKGVGFIKTAWDKVKDVAKKPIQFVIDVVYNGGIVKVWNAVADALGIKEKLKPISIDGFARGGIYPGYTPGRDIGFAAVSGGEAIMRPEWTRAVGEDYVNKMNAAARRGGVAGVVRALGIAGDPGFAGAYAGGGIVGSIKDALAGGLRLGAEKLLNPLLDQAEAAMGGSPWGKLLTALPRKLVALVLEKIGARESESGGVAGAKAVAWARQQLGKPYIWGGVGPAGFDCSGLTSQAWKHAGVTDIPRTSQQQMAWVKPVQTPVPGDLGFPHSGHVWMYTGPNTIIEAPHTGAVVREVAARSAQLIGRPPSLFDNGGLLMPGTSLVHNGTGRPEPVMTDQQWEAVMSGGRSGGGPLVNIEGDFVARQDASPYGIALELRRIMGSRVRSM